MIDSGYLAKGLNAMARAHLVSPMSGHLGAAVVAGSFISEQHPDLDDAVCGGIEGELERIVQGGSVFGPREGATLSAPEMFEPFATESPDGSRIDGIAEALAGNIDQTRQSGHNVIFASIAIRALRSHPELAIPAVIDGIRALVASFDGGSPGSGYYGKEKGRIAGQNVPLPDDDALPPFPDLATMANTVIDDLIQHAAKNRSGFGGLWHVINHAAGLAELARYGYPELAAMGLAAQRQHVRLWRTVPDAAGELGPETPTEHDPLTAAFWQSDQIRRERAHLTHRIKTMYGFDALVSLVEDEGKRSRGRDRLRYLM